MKIDGKAIAEDLISQLKLRVEKLKDNGVIPYLYIVTFGSNSQTESYLKQKKLRASQIGARVTVRSFATNTPPNTIYALIETLNKDKNIHGIIVQRPLPKQFKEEDVSKSVVLNKDVDGFKSGSNFKPPIALAVIKAIESTLPNEDIYEFLKEKKIVILGKGITAGAPTIKLFKELGIKHVVIDSKTKDREKILKKADIVISAVGKKVIEANDIKKNSILIGIGMHIESGKLKGDYDGMEIETKTSFYTPTPGGIGPINVTMLMKNLVEAAEQQSAIINS